MTVGVIHRPGDAYSLRLYEEMISNHLKANGVNIVHIPPEFAEPKAGIDLVWDPGLAGVRIPPDVLMRTAVPIVVTVHGLRGFVLPWKMVHNNLFTAAKVWFRKRLMLKKWQVLREKVGAVIVPSGHSADEAVRVLGIDRGKITAIPHGYNRKLFYPARQTRAQDDPYFLVVSQNRPVKNVNRIIRAYELLDGHPKPRLIAVQAGSRDNRPVKGVIRLTEGVSDETLADLYRHALALVFPSLHEGFGLPILEAMASGCPVITSNATACAEIAGDAALLVNPYSVEEICNAMRMMLDPDTRRKYRDLGLKRASSFSWERAGMQHLNVFNQLLQVKR